MFNVLYYILYTQTFLSAILKIQMSSFLVIKILILRIKILKNDFTKYFIK